MSQPPLALHRHTDSTAHDFDFLHGRWRVHNRRLANPLTGSDAWDEFDAVSDVRPLWDGQGHLEEWDADMPGGAIRAVSLQLFDPVARQWRLHWATNRDGHVGIPTVGAFREGTGYFFATEEFRGRAILLRIIWQDC